MTTDSHSFAMCTTRLVTHSNLWISRLSSLTLLVLYYATATHAATTTVWATPHDSYSSSIGVLGCKVDTDRIAYWPGSVDCNNLCVSLSYGDRKVKLLRIDQSQGAHDISYDAWNYLTTGHGANDRPAVGGPIEMQTEELDASECKDLIHTEGHKLPLSAANSMNFLASCLDHKNGSWVGENYILYNILDSICTWGYDEPCELNWPSANQAQCKHALGTPNTLKDDPVYDIKYPSGNKVIAGSGEVVKTGGTPWGDVGGTGQENAATRGLVAGSSATRLIVWIMTLMSYVALCWI